MRLSESYLCYSPGYVETHKKEKFLKAVEATKNEKGVVEHFYGPVGLFNTELFREIGILDDRYDWSCDDLDLAWRMKLRGIESVTSKKITVGHHFGETLTSTPNWDIISDLNKERFYNKHGYQSYRDIRNEYKIHHRYFTKFR